MAVNAGCTCEPLIRTLGRGRVDITTHIQLHCWVTLNPRVTSLPYSAFNCPVNRMISTMHLSSFWYHKSSSEEVLVACRFACGLFIAPLIQAFIETNTTYMLEQLGLTFRNSLMGAIYRKTLRLNSSALTKDGTGKIVTLMSNDASKVQVCATQASSSCAAGSMRAGISQSKDSFQVGGSWAHF